MGIIIHNSQIIIHKCWVILSSTMTNCLAKLFTNESYRTKSVQSNSQLTMNPPCSVCLAPSVITVEVLYRWYKAHDSHESTLKSWCFQIQSIMIPCNPRAACILSHPSSSFLPYLGFLRPSFDIAQARVWDMQKIYYHLYVNFWRWRYSFMYAPS